MTLMERIKEANKPKDEVSPTRACLFCGSSDHVWDCADVVPWSSACKECGCEDGHWDGCSYVAGIF
jgi:hypothetical protein